MSNWLRAEYLPPGLRELADAKQLSEVQVKQLAQAWDTMRGKRPTTLAEWLPLYEAVAVYLSTQKENEREHTKERNDGVQP